MNGSNSVNHNIPDAGKGEPSSLKEAQHKVRNYVHVNQGIANILLASDNITPKQRELLVVLKDNSNLLQNSVDDIFDLAETFLPH